MGNRTIQTGSDGSCLHPPVHKPFRSMQTCLIIVFLARLQRKHDKVYQWKALRMISRESLPIFAKTALAGDLEAAARGFFPDEARSWETLRIRSGVLHSSLGLADLADESQEVAHSSLGE